MKEIQTKGTIKLEGENRIESPLITVICANDSYANKSVLVSIKLKTESTILGRDIGSFTYKETWADNDVEAYVLKWISNNIEK